MNRVKLVYIAGPFSAPTREGVEKNIAEAERIALTVAALGGFPVCPHTNTGHREFESLQPYDFWIAGTTKVLTRCDAIVNTPRWLESSGARRENYVSDAMGLPMFFAGEPGWREALSAWLRGGA